jgi:hypothetical protein
MRRTKRSRAVKSITRVILAAILVCAVGFVPCYAQSYSSSLSSLLALSSIESVVGPIFPAKGLCATFRSEVGTGVRLGDVVSAKLTGANQGEFNLRSANFLDESPLRFDTYAILRFWRFGARGAYSNAETRTRGVNGGHIDFSGLILGADFDAVQFQWLTLGTSVDFYFINPTIQGAFVTAPPVLGPSSSTAGITTLTNFPTVINGATVNIKGDRPITWGTYLRYVPPEILGFPVHIEARYIVPLKGSKLTIYGASLAFRPQIYRFDVSCKLIAEKTHLKFQNDSQIQLFNLNSNTYTTAAAYKIVTDPLSPPPPPLPPYPPPLPPADFITTYNSNTLFSTSSVPTSQQNWELDMEWKYFGIEFAVYF